jgi:hypothetical protein
MRKTQKAASQRQKIKEQRAEKLSAFFMPRPEFM